MALLSAVLVAGSSCLQNYCGIKDSCLLMKAKIHLLPWEETGKLVFVKCECLYTGELWKLLILFPCLVK